MFVINYLLSAKFASYRNSAPAFVGLQAVTVRKCRNGHQLTFSPIAPFSSLSPPKNTRHVLVQLELYLKPNFTMETVENLIIICE